MPKHEVEHDDPLELVGVPIPESDLDEIAEAFVEEYIRMDFDRARILALFKNPFYRGTHQIYLQKGEGYLNEVIDRVITRWHS